MHGFKSFANKTEVPFDNKFNCILGPNGSGKSNVGDAICFVLGRLSAKSMRAEKAANLIFNGGKKKTPARSAYVEIAFDNANKTFPVEGKEIIINRTITTKGSSIYRINGKKRTRTEILDLLANARINPEGYNIILQGDIMRFVDMSPVERRKVIESISDISIYEEKKHKADLELNKVEDKLNNATIILKERKTHLRELKKDRDQALKFKSLKDQIDSNKATHLHLQIADLDKVKAKYDKEIAKYQDKISGSEKKVEQLKSKVADNKAIIAEINKEIEQKGEKEQVKVHREIEDMKISLTKDKARVSTLKDEINKIQQRKDQFDIEMDELENKASVNVEKKKELQEKIKRKEQELKEVEKNILQFKKKHKIESSGELETELEEKDKLIDQKQEEVQTVRQKQQELLREKDKIEYQLETLDEKIKKVKEVEQENKSQIKELQKKKNEFKSTTVRLNKCLDEDSGFASQLSNARKGLVGLQEEHAKLNAKTASIQAGLSSNRAVASIISNKNKFKGVHGTVSELGQVNKKFSKALEAAAGARMQNLVVEDDQVAADCIKYLKNNKLGSASFIPLNKIRSISISCDNKKLLGKSGVHDFALNLISYKPQFKKAFTYVFGNTLVVEDIDTARRVGIGKIKMTALDGNIVEASGVMRGGFQARKTAMGFKEKDSLEKLDHVEAEISELQGVLSNIEHKRESNEQEISSLRNFRSELEADIIKLEKILHLEGGDLDANSGLKKELRDRLKEVDTELSSFQKQINQINQELAKHKSKKMILRSQVNELRNPRLLAQLSAYEDARQEGKNDLVKLNAELGNISMQIEEMIAPERNKIQEILRQHRKEDEQFKKEIKTLSEKIGKEEKTLSDKEKASKAFYAKYKELFNKREKLSAEANKYDIEVESIRDRSRTSEREINVHSLKNAEVKAKLAGLNESFAQYKGVELLKGQTIDVLKHEINKFEVMLGQMSAVNMKALEIYEEVEKEYNDLMEKKNNLNVEKTDVLTLMNEIETKKKDHFMETFNKANENFERIFANLFSKGNAFLQLDNPDKPFEDGLSIRVKLTGTRYMDIKSLSGGEKTLTALSFIFAIQEYQPATFYILDEIDAALDKHNSEKLSKLIRSYSDKAQYIIISHNDSIISEADNLYGVSMNTHISKITTLKI